MSTPRTDLFRLCWHENKRINWPCSFESAAFSELEKLETELAAVTKERDAFRAAFCNGPDYDTGETPEQARERFDKNGEIEGVSAVIIARELAKELTAERAKVAKLRDACEWIAKLYDDGKPIHSVAMDAYSMKCEAAKALTETAPKEGGE